MLASIDSPQGDQLDRNAATSATAAPITVAKPDDMAQAA
jgi:hypothetical protein